MRIAIFSISEADEALDKPTKPGADSQQTKQVKRRAPSEDQAQAKRMKTIPKPALQPQSPDLDNSDGFPELEKIPSTTGGKSSANVIADVDEDNKGDKEGIRADEGGEYSEDEGEVREQDEGRSDNKAVEQVLPVAKLPAPK
jgi:hypothetical protein